MALVRAAIETALAAGKIVCIALHHGSVLEIRDTASLYAQDF